MDSSSINLIFTQIRNVITGTLFFLCRVTLLLFNILINMYFMSISPTDTPVDLIFWLLVKFLGLWLNLSLPLTLVVTLHYFGLFILSHGSLLRKYPMSKTENTLGMMFSELNLLTGSPGEVNYEINILKETYCFPYQKGVS